MARSKGCRPRKAVRERVEQLKRELAEIDSDKWQAAYNKHQQIQELCNVNAGPSGGLMCPRLCSYCKRWGHNKSHCELREAHYNRWRDREIRNLAVFTPPTEGEPGYEDWVRYEAVKARTRSFTPDVCTGDGGSGCWCAACVAWRKHLAGDALCREFFHGTIDFQALEEDGRA